jgi:hypothetical protein
MEIYYTAIGRAHSICYSTSLWYSRYSVTRCDWAHAVLRNQLGKPDDREGSMGEGEGERGEEEEEEDEEGGIEETSL